MSKKTNTVEAPVLGAIDKVAGHVGKQLASMLRDSISRGDLRPGERLPSTRTLSTSLGIARGTVTEVFGQLIAEGYLEAKIGAGTLVAHTIADPQWETSSPRPEPDSCNAPVLPTNAERYAAVARTLTPLPGIPFAIGVPRDEVALDDNWRRLANRIRSTQIAAPSSYSDPTGLPALRKAIADYVRKSRAVVCSPENVIVLSGTQQGLFVASKVLLSPGDVAWAEDPAYPGVTAVLADVNAHVLRVPVDPNGMDVEYAIGTLNAARAVFVTPSHQYPLGMPLSMSRRKTLLSWARENGAWIVEDDYDSELRYAGHPFPSMQGLAPSRVIYLGTFSKVLAPSLRLGYAVVPTPLVEAFNGARQLMDRHAPTGDQYVVASYMQEGHFEAHIRRIRGIYADRRATLIAEIQKQIYEVEVQPSDQGSHLIIWFRDPVEDRQVAARAAAAGIAVKAISPMYAGPGRRSGLMLGFGGFSTEQIEQAVAKLAVVIREFA
ncbi:PLP-dependent aminotransferase family protein [Paraburkholderia bengalensis]|uniref:PLP-dependent aminotransferase family protein n=1 Tax=Paraburkholderia bengalensis TaxID=2747562 RepID=A0ABU8ILI7_9BURK